jgi:hypothetical protein
MFSAGRSMGYLNLDNLDHDPRLAQALGNMVVAWSRAETQLLNVFACVMNVHFNLATAAFYRIPTFEARTKVVLGILKDWNNRSVNSDEVKAEITALNRLSKTRNNWVHGVWCVDESNDSDTVIFDFRADDKSGRRNRPVVIADVANHLAAVRNRVTALNKLIPFYYYPKSLR